MPGPTPASAWASSTTWCGRPRDQGSGDRPRVTPPHDARGQIEDHAGGRRLGDRHVDGGSGEGRGLRRDVPGEYTVRRWRRGQLSSGRAGGAPRPPLPFIRVLLLFPSPSRGPVAHIAPPPPTRRA